MDSSSYNHKKRIQNYVGFLTFISKYIYNLQIILRPFYLQLRDTTDFKSAPELQQRFDRVKKELSDRPFRLAIPNSEKPFYILCGDSNYGHGAALLQKKSIWENGISIIKLTSIFYHRT